MAHTDVTHRFVLTGLVEAEEPLVKAPDGHVFTRPVSLWATTYGQIQPDGSIIPTKDREGQVMEAAKELGRINWKPYLSNGLWNDRHDRTTIVGRPLTLDFHDSSSAFGRQHGKIGFHTTGLLFDRDDPRSFGDYRPTEKELRKADEYWERRHTPGALGGSVDGTCKLSPCRKRIVSATIDQLALHPTPHNPDAIATAMGDHPLEWLRKGLVEAGPCGKCVCPPGTCGALLKGPNELEEHVDEREGKGDEPDWDELKKSKEWKKQIAWLMGRFPYLDEEAAASVLKTQVLNYMAKMKGFYNA